MKKTYFIWLAIHGVVWTFILFFIPFELNVRRLASICLFLIILFIQPLFSEKSIIQSILFCIQMMSTLTLFYPLQREFYPFLLLIQMLIIAETVFYLSFQKSLFVILLALGSTVWIIMQSNLTSTQLTWCGLFYLLIISGMLHYQAIRKRKTDLQQKNAALLDEYRKMKRQLLIEEEKARLDERTLIGHEIHDSVGHKLTALLMQLEAFRLTAAETEQEKINLLKDLADQSLAETRRAVKSFKEKEVSGLQGVIRLIRKLEIESFMKIHFTVKHGAFAAPLTGEQSFAIYRAVQEALTNIMKHSSTREAQVSFQSPGGSIFRFEVSNLITPNHYFQEGYGLKAMRERLAKVGGELDIRADQRRFIVRGSISLNRTEESR